MFQKYRIAWLVLLLLIVANFTANSQNSPQVSVGTLLRFPLVQSQDITPRTVYIWLPSRFAANQAKAFKVLYMHDGQMLFDSTITWNKDAWMVANIADSLQNTQTVEPFIIVGIENGGVTRHADYFPQDVFEQLPTATQTTFLQAARANGASVFNKQSLRANAYLTFIQRQVKPLVDSVLGYTTTANQNYIMGSSMGGLISVYALCKQPQFWAGAACLSTHWPGIFSLQNNPFPAAITQYINTYLPVPGQGKKLYMDCGTATLDSLYPSIQNEVNKVVMKKGYNHLQYQSLVFQNAAHTEAAWRARVAIPLLFLFSKK